MARGKTPKTPKRAKRRLNPDRVPEINLPEHPRATGAELREAMEKQWARGAVNNGAKKARWRP